MSNHSHAGGGSGSSLTRTAFMATLHCLTGCAIGEVLGMVIGTALGWSAAATIALSIVLAFAFGYSLTMLPLLRAGLALSVALPLAFASDSLSIALMETVDNGIMLAVPGAMDATLASPLFWSALAVALLAAFVLAFPLNRALIARGQGHAVVHGFHGGHGDGGSEAHGLPSPRRFVLVGLAAIVATVAVAVGGALVVEGGHDDEPVRGHEQPVHAAGEA